MRAVGLVGEGSECFGFEDALSLDCDFGPGFCLWLNSSDMKEIGAASQEAYDRLPDIFEGFPTRRDHSMSGHRTGVWETGELYHQFPGIRKVPENSDMIRWLLLPEQALATATNGRIFRDDTGEFTQIRKALKYDYPP